VAAVFDGNATFELDPPTSIEQHQIARFTGQPRLTEQFKRAVYFFTDDSWVELQKLVVIGPRGDADATGKVLAANQSKYERNFNSWWENERNGNPVMSNLAARMLADLTDPTSKGLFLADVQGGRYGGLLYQISWNRPSILLPMLNNDEEVMLLRYKTGEYSEWWAGFHLKAEYGGHAHPAHSMLIAHCENDSISADISKSNDLSATARMEFTVPAGAPRVLPFDLAGVLRISAVTDGAAKPLGFIQEPRDADSDPWLILPSPAVQGITYTAQIAYQEDSTRDSRVIDKQGNGLFFVGARTSWFPSFRPFDDRTNFRLQFTSPKNYQFIATGRLVDSKKEKSGLVSDYVSQIPFSVVGFNYGDFVAKSFSDKTLTVTAYAGKNIPDELANLNSRLQIAQLAQGPGGSDVAARYGILQGGFNTAAGAKFAAAKSYQAFRLYEAYFGPLPFHKISVTEQPVGFFGQSWPTLIFLPYLSLLDTTTLNSLRLQNTAENREFFDVVAMHEMSHQWWGHMVGWKTYHDQWLSEGFADFSAALYLQMYEPKKLKAFWDYDRQLLLSKDRAGHRPVDIGPIWLNTQLNAYLEPDASRILIYRKGAYVLEILRTIMQNPRAQNPDANFMAMMHDFVRTYAGKNASTEDFERIAEKYCHEDMHWFFNEWVYGVETPEYDFGYQLSDGPSGKTVLHMSLTQSGVSQAFAMSVPVYLDLKDKWYLMGFVHISG
ncbi:MAG: M1 family aminopeptidase, partial [Terriglobia bacterium]